LLTVSRDDLSFCPEDFTQVLEYEKGQTLFQEGSSAYGYYLICEGRIKLAKRSAVGKKALLGIWGPGDIIGPANDGHYRLYAEALEKTKVAYIDRQDFSQLLARHPTLASALVEKLTSELGRLQERLYSAIQPRANAKLAHLLLELASEFGKTTSHGVLIDLTLSRAELAEMAGLSRETVSLILRTFETQGWIKTQKRKIFVCDQIGLRSSL
jgi:CRP/FNR family transcriptional regulator